MTETTAMYRSAPQSVARWGALVLNGFAFVAVNASIYRALALFVERNGEVYRRPPTISRAVSDPYIGEPFAVWISISGVCLFLGVALLMRLHLSMRTALAPDARTYRALSVLAPSCLAAQGLAAIGMYITSTYRLPDANEMHMIGSFIFFGAQLLVVLLYNVFNGIVLSDGESLNRLHKARLLHRRAVVLRLWLGLGVGALTVVYFGLFVAKNVFPSEQYPTLYWLYTRTEPAVISGFLVVLACAHLDLFRQRPQSA